MKNIRLLILGFAAALCAPTRFTTANAGAATPADQKPADQKPGDNSADIAALRKEMEALRAENTSNKLVIENMREEHLEALEGAREAFESLKPGTTAKDDSGESNDTSMLALAARGAGVEVKDVKWRIAAGLTVEQAVQAALTQKRADANKAARLKKAAK